MRALIELGGIGSTADLVAASSWAAVRAAVADGSIVRVARGHYTVAGLADPALGGQAPTRAWSRWHEGPSADEVAVLTARYAIARGRGGALSGLCAAAHHGWPILQEPRRIDITLPPSRKAPRYGPADVTRYTHRVLTDAEWADRVTSPLRTVLDCARSLPFAQALTVADSALRCESVGPLELREQADMARGRGAGLVRRVALCADARAANPFESALRAVHDDLPGLHLEPQLQICGDGLNVHLDMADERLRIVVEADSYAFHGDRERFERTQRRQVELAGRDWIVLPYGFAAATQESEWVRARTQAVVHVRHSRGYGAA